MAAVYQKCSNKFCVPIDVGTSLIVVAHNDLKVQCGASR